MNRDEGYEQFALNYLMKTRVNLLTNFVLMHAFLVSLQITSLFGFICATSNITMVPNYANIMDIHLVSLEVSLLF